MTESIDEKKTNDIESSSSQPKNPTEYNPRWKGYSLIILSSFVSLTAISNVSQNDTEIKASWGPSVAFGSLTFTISFLVLLFDRLQCCESKFNYTKALDGKIEGCMLVFFVVWWIVGVAIITASDGIAYKALNIYFSSWTALFACIYTLNKWLTAKAIISIHELTRLSKTLPSWWALFLASMVEFGSAADMLKDIPKPTRGNASLGISTGVISAIVSFVFIMEHYNIRCIPFIRHGGWTELAFVAVMVLLWVITLAILTQDEGIAASISGTGTTKFSTEIGNISDCDISVSATDSDGVVRTYTVDGCLIFPGSNLFLAAWSCLISSLIIAFRWKAAQALQFAQAQNQDILGTKSSPKGENGVGDDEEGEDDDAI